MSGEETTQKDDGETEQGSVSSVVVVARVRNFV